MLRPTTFGANALNPGCPNVKTPWQFFIYVLGSRQEALTSLSFERPRCRNCFGSSRTSDYLQRTWCSQSESNACYRHTKAVYYLCTIGAKTLAYGFEPYFSRLAPGQGFCFRSADLTLERALGACSLQHLGDSVDLWGNAPQRLCLQGSVPFLWQAQKWRYRSARRGFHPSQPPSGSDYSAS